MLLQEKLLAIFNNNGFVKGKIMSKSAFVFSFVLTVSTGVYAGTTNLLMTIRTLEAKGEYTNVVMLCKAHTNEAVALFTLGDYAFHGRKDVLVKDIGQCGHYYRCATEALKKAAEAGEAEAQFMLASCYEYSNGNNLILARTWYLKAAEQGHAKAMCKAAMFVAKNKGGYLDGEARKAIMMRYVNAAIAAKEPNGKALLATTYFEKRDIKQALPLIQEAVEEGSAIGQMLLGNMYYYGMGVAKDIDKAKHYLRLASDQGYSDVHIMLEQIAKEQEKRIAAP
jgi:TPR repeat protein